MRSTVYEAVVKQRTSEKYQPGDNGNPMKFAQSPADQVSSEMGVGQNLKRSWCQDERKENQSADPDDERKQHEVTEEGHRERIIAFVAGGLQTRRSGGLGTRTARARRPAR